MQKYVALLRGINVGGNKKVEMKKLKKIFELLGFINIATYINSGNVIFESDKKSLAILALEIEKALKKNLGFEVRVVIRDAENIQKVSKAIPRDWTNDTEQKSDVIFLWDHFDKKETLKLITVNKDVDNLKYVSGAIIWNIKRSDYNKSGMHDFIGSQVYKHMTARNVNTVRKLASLME